MKQLLESLELLEAAGPVKKGVWRKVKSTSGQQHHFDHEHEDGHVTRVVVRSQRRDGISWTRRVSMGRVDQDGSFKPYPAGPGDTSADSTIAAIQQHGQAIQEFMGQTADLHAHPDRDVRGKAKLAIDTRHRVQDAIDAACDAAQDD